MRGAVALLDHMQDILEAGMATQIETVRTTLDPTTELPDIARVYQEEWDYGQLQDTPALVVYEADLIVQETAGLVVFRVPVDVIGWDVCDADGMGQLHRRLKWYRYCVTNLILVNYRSERPYWDAVTLSAMPADVPMQEETIGVYGRGLGVRFLLDVTETYY